MLRKRIVEEKNNHLDWTRVLTMLDYARHRKIKPYTHNNGSLASAFGRVFQAQVFSGI